MKRCLWIAVSCIMVACLFAGCDLWTNGAYHSVEPHMQEDYLPNQYNREFSTFEELEQILDYMVDHGETSNLLYMRDISTQQMEGYISVAISNIKNAHPIGAYAVDEITYEIGNNSGRWAISIDISYVHPRSEILRIQDAANMTEASLIIAGALDNYEASVVMLIEEYEPTDFIQLVQDYVVMNPQSCMEMPQVSANVYPDRGTERVVELFFSYQTSRDSLRDMQEKVQTVFDSAKLYVSENAGHWETYSQLYAFLMERFDYDVETSITPAYSLLHHGVGDSKAFATVYAALCRQAGLDCDVISGTREGQPLHWNVLKVDGTYYYVDLLQCNQRGKFFARQQNEMNSYVWDYSQN